MRKINKKILITGANGFLAGNFAKYLKEKTDYKIVGLIREKSKSLASSDFDELIIYDGTQDSIDKINWEEFMYVFHLAAYFTTKKEIEEEIKLINSIILLSVQLMNSLQKANSLIPFIAASTFSSYNKNHEYKPDNLYSVLKYTVEEIAKGFDINSSFISLSDTFGSNDTRPKVHNLVRDGKIKKLNSSYKQKMILTHAEDVARAFLQVAELNNTNKKQFNRYDLFPKENETTLGEFLTLINPNIEFGDELKDRMPYEKYPIMNYKPIHSLEEIKEV